MTKNGTETNFQTITVMDDNGAIIGSTYPKRAKGLVKRCRAVYVSDNAIRLSNCPTYNNELYTEELTMDINTEITLEQNEQVTAPIEADSKKVNYLYFNPKEWMKHPDVVRTTNLERFFINSPFSSDMTEVVSIGTWNNDWCEITNGMLRLERNTEYHFVFWLNGGENDNNSETCQMQVMFTNNSLQVSLTEWDEKLSYKLNRSHVKPIKKYKGWQLYDIPFITGDKEYTQIRFVSQRAPMALMHASDTGQYSGLEDIVDEFSAKRPQRHNIAFEDGWPTNAWYSTENLRNGGNTASGFADNMASNFGDNSTGFNFGSFPNMFNADELRQRILAELDMDEIMEQIMAEIDLGEIGDEITSQIKESFKK